MPSGESTTFGVRFFVAPGLLDGLPVINTATVESRTPDANLTNNTATVCSSVRVSGGCSGDGGGDDGGGLPNPRATPELDSLVLFGTGAAGLASYLRMRVRGARRKKGYSMPR
jgi:hypothetical protein